jgi:hypothetical protein
LPPEHALAFINALAASKTITTLDLRSNHLGNLGEHAIAFINALAASKTITTLDLYANNLGNLGEHAVAFIEALAASPTITTLNLGANDLGNLGEHLKPFYDTLTETAQKTKLKLITGLELPASAELPLAQSFLKLRQALQKAVPFHIVFYRQLNPKKKGLEESLLALPGLLHHISSFLKKPVHLHIVFYKQLNPEKNYSSKEQAAEQEEPKHPILALPQALLHHISSFLNGEEDPLRNKKQEDPFGSQTLSNQLITTIAEPKAAATPETQTDKKSTSSGCICQ